nr:hypothetical protein [Tanacetum cinerariifolium]
MRMSTWLKVVSKGRSATKDKGKAIIQESKSPKKIKKKKMMQISLDEVKVLKDLVKKNWDMNKKVKEEIAHQVDVVAKQAEKEYSKKALRKLKED